MPETTLGIPTEFILVGMFIILLLNTFWGKHNKIISGIASLSFGYSLLLPMLVGFEPLKASENLKWSWFASVLLFMILSCFWLFFDTVPLSKKMLDKLKEE